MRNYQYAQMLGGGISLGEALTSWHSFATMGCLWLPTMSSHKYSIQPELAAGMPFIFYVTRLQHSCDYCCPEAGEILFTAGCTFGNQIASALLSTQSLKSLQRRISVQNFGLLYGKGQFGLDRTAHSAAPRLRLQCVPQVRIQQHTDC